jgi:hypothetical protein
MKEVYTRFLKEISTQRIQIEKDIAMIERGLEEKDCFIPIVDVDKLLKARVILVIYMSVLARLVEEIEQKERG